MTTQVWSEQEIGLLRATYGTMSSRQLQAVHFPDRTDSAIRKQAQRIGLAGPANHWSQKENRILRRYYGKKTVQEIHDRYLPDRTPHAIISHALVLGIENAYKTDWEPDEISVLKANYQKVSPGEIQRLLPCHTLSSIKAKAFKLGLQEPDNADERRKLQAGVMHGTNLTRVRSTAPNKNNTTGAKGVEYVKSRKKFRAVLHYKGRHKHLGYYLTVEDAVKARDAQIKAIEPELRAIEADIRDRLAKL